MTPSEIQRTAMVTSSAIAQRINRLEQGGLVVHSPNDSDGRATDVTLTAEGLALIERALPEHVDTEHLLLHALTSEQRNQLSHQPSRNQLPFPGNQCIFDRAVENSTHIVVNRSGVFGFRIGEMVVCSGY